MSHVEGLVSSDRLIPALPWAGVLSQPLSASLPAHRRNATYDSQRFSHPRDRGTVVMAVVFGVRLEDVTRFGLCRLLDMPKKRAEAGLPRAAPLRPSFTSLEGCRCARRLAPHTKFSPMMYMKSFSAPPHIALWSLALRAHGFRPQTTLLNTLLFFSTRSVRSCIAMNSHCSTRTVVTTANCGARTCIVVHHGKLQEAVSALSP